MPLICETTEKVNYMYPRVQGMEGACAILTSEADGNFYYKPALNTNTSRTEALLKALNVVKNNPSKGYIIKLGKGAFNIFDGFPLISYITVLGVPNTNLIVQLTEEARLIYENPADAGSDYSLFRGPRNIVNFGAIPDDYDHDSYPGILSAMNSLPPFIGADPDLNGNIVRYGEIYMPQGIYAISDTVEPTAYMTIKKEGRLGFWAMPSFAPGTGPEKFMLKQGLHNPEGANFTHNVNIDDGIIFIGNSADNDSLSAVSVGSCQMSNIDVALSGIAKRGVVIAGKTNFTRIKLDCSNIGEGPALEIANANSIHLDQISCVNVNVDGANLIDGFAMPAVYIHSNSALIVAGNILAESCPHAMYLKGVRSSVFDSVEFYKGGASGTGIGVTLHSDCDIVQLNAIRTHSATVMVNHVGKVSLSGSGSDYSYRSYATHLSSTQFNVEGATTGNGINFWRVDSDTVVKNFKLVGGSSTSNPTLSLQATDINGASLVEYMSWAGNNGGDLTGFNISVRNLYSEGHVKVKAGSNYYGAPYCPTYADDATADADGSLVSGGLYRTTAGGRAVFRKP